MKLADSNIVASVLDLLARMDEALQHSKESTPAVLTAIAAELVDALERSTQRIESSVNAVNEQLTAELLALQARVSETTARIVELSDRSDALQRAVHSRIEMLETGGVNLRDAIQQLDSEVSELRKEED